MGPQTPARQLIVWMLLLMLFFAMFHLSAQRRASAPEKIRFNPEFMELAKQKVIHEVEVVAEVSGQQYIKGTLTELDDRGQRKRFRTDVFMYDGLPGLLTEMGIPFAFKSENPVF